MSKTKLGLLILIALSILVLAGRSSSRFVFDFTSKSIVKQPNNPELKKIVTQDLKGVDGTFGIYIEELEASESSAISNQPSDKKKRYVLNENMEFPAASLYKLVLLAALEDALEKGQTKETDQISSTKSHLKNVFGGVDFGYDDMPEQINFTIEEALERVGRISDNFASIMLTEKIRQLSAISRQSSDSSSNLRFSESNDLKVFDPEVSDRRADRSAKDRSSLKTENYLDPLQSMAQTLGMTNTKFPEDGPTTTPEDIGKFFKLLYEGKIVSPERSKKIEEILMLSKINNRIPDKLPEGLKIVHKTGELAHIRHDAGIIYMPNPSIPSNPSNPPAYIIVLLSKDLKYEDDGVEALAQISKDVFDYFKGLEGR